MALAVATVPTLESGDRLTPEEFDRIYAGMPDVRAELINGVVYVSSPVRVDNHAQPLALLLGVVFVYHAGRPGLACFSDGSFYTDAGDRTQPDVCLYRTTFPRSAWVSDDGYLRGSPEFIAEVAASSASYDLHDKLRAYQDAGVKEYLVWRVLEREFSFFRLVDGAYQPVAADADGVFESVEFPGLRIDAPSLIAGDAQKAVAALR